MAGVRRILALSSLSGLASEINGQGMEGDSTENDGNPCVRQSWPLPSAQLSRCGANEHLVVKREPRLRETCASCLAGTVFTGADPDRPCQFPDGSLCPAGYSAAFQYCQSERTDEHNHRICECPEGWRVHTYSFSNGLSWCGCLSHNVTTPLSEARCPVEGYVMAPGNVDHCFASECSIGQTGIPPESVEVYHLVRDPGPISPQTNCTAVHCASAILDATQRSCQHLSANVTDSNQDRCSCTCTGGFGGSDYLCNSARPTCEVNTCGPNVTVARGSYTVAANDSITITCDNENHAVVGFAGNNSPTVSCADARDQEFVCRPATRTKMKWFYWPQDAARTCRDGYERYRNRRISNYYVCAKCPTYEGYTGPVRDQSLKAPYLLQCFYTLD